MEKLKPHAWKMLAAIGSIFIIWGVHQIANIPREQASHWAWLTADPEVLEYIKWWFQIHGVWTLANGLFFTLTAATAFRAGEPWSRWALLYLPVHILLLSVRFYWLAVITIPLILVVVLALRAGWENVSNMSTPSPPGRAWLVFIPIGLLILYYAYDNLFAIPALEPADPARGWDWLTTDPAVIDYSKFYFRNLGLRALSIGLLTLITAAAGLRQASRHAWWILWIVPALFLVHLFFWPWLALPLIGLAMVGAVGLALTYPKPVQVWDE